MKAVRDGEPKTSASGADGSGPMGTLSSGLFPVAHSVFFSEALRAQVAQAYPIVEPVTCHLLEASLNDTYLLSTREDRYIARVYGARWRSLSEICYELELLTHLSGRGVSVSVPLATKDGTLTHQLEAPEGPRHLVLFTYAEGTPFSWNEEQCYKAGHVLAAIHAASGDFVSQHSRFPLDLQYLIDRPLAALRPFLAQRPKDCHYLEGFAARLRARTETAANVGLDWGVCHGDFGGNIHVSSDRILTVFDFDLCSPGWLAYDLVVFQWGAMSRKREGIWDAFLTGYRERRRLSALDLAAVPLFRAIRHLWTMGLRASQVDQVGTLPLSDAYFDYRLAFFRRWEAEHLEGK